jgi:membrane protein required for colicin V production
MLSQQMPSFSCVVASKQKKPLLLARFGFNQGGMIEASLNMFDAVVILVFLLSTLLAFFRGFVREVLSLGAWLGAGIITLYAFEPVSSWLKHHTTKPMVAYLLGGLGTYIVVLIAISIVNAIIIRYIKSGSEVGMLDNLLGLGFGALRGAFIVSLGYLVLTLIVDEESPPSWVKEAQTRNFAKQGALTLASVAPTYLADISSLRDKLKEESGAKKEGEKEGEAKTPVADGEHGYSSQQRQLLESIMGAGEATKQKP